MYKSYNIKFNKEINFIHPGEYFSSIEDIIISTILGSCVSVVLIDMVNQICGMNHFMLTSTLKEEFYKSKSGKYGIYAMELLINDMMKKGGERKNFSAKVFGGASVLKSMTSNTNTISSDNIQFALDFLKTESITVKSLDVGGYNARKIHLFPLTGKILLKRIPISSVPSIEKEEKEYFDFISNKYKL